MASHGLLIASGLFLAAALLPLLARRLVRRSERVDGAPTLSLVRATSIAEAGCATALLLLGVLSHGHLIALGHVWRHDIWSALLFGALGGLALHFVGGGSPLPIAALRTARLPAARSRAGLGTVALFLLGEACTVVVWFGAALPTLARGPSRLLALLLVAGGYGCGRAAAGEDHPLLGAVDGVLLGLLATLTGSLLTVGIAQLVADLLAYVSAASHAEETALAIDAGAPYPSSLSDR